MNIELTEQELQVIMSAMVGEVHRTKFSYLRDITESVYKKLIDFNANNKL